MDFVVLNKLKIFKTNTDVSVDHGSVDLMPMPKIDMYSNKLTDRLRVEQLAIKELYMGLLDSHEKGDLKALTKYLAQFRKEYLAYTITVKTKLHIEIRHHQTCIEDQMTLQAVTKLSDTLKSELVSFFTFWNETKIDQETHVYTQKLSKIGDLLQECYSMEEQVLFPLHEGIPSIANNSPGKAHSSEINAPHTEFLDLSEPESFLELDATD